MMIDIYVIATWIEQLSDWWVIGAIVAWFYIHTLLEMDTNGRLDRTYDWIRRFVVWSFEYDAPQWLVRLVYRVVTVHPDPYHFMTHLRYPVFWFWMTGAILKWGWWTGPVIWLVLIFFVFDIHYHWLLMEPAYRDQWKPIWRWKR